MPSLFSLTPPFTRNEVFIALVYFVQGAGSLTAIASSLILRESLHLDFWQMGLIGAASVVPWSVKPLYGLLSDLFPIGGYRRRPYLHLGPLLAMLGFFGVATLGHSFLGFLIPLLVANIGLGLTDTATDGLVVESSTSESAARFQAISQGAIRIAAFVTSFFSGLLIARGIATPHEVFLIAALFPLSTFIFSWFVDEKRETGATERKVHEILTPRMIGAMAAIFVAIIGATAFSGSIATTLRLPEGGVVALPWLVFAAWIGLYFQKLISLRLASSAIFLAALFLLLWRFNPGAGSPLFFYLKDTLGVSEESLGFVGTASQVGSILAVFGAAALARRIETKTLLFLTTLAAALFGASAFAITHPHLAEAFGSSSIVRIFSAIVALPVMAANALFGLAGGLTAISPFAAALDLSPIERFLYLQSFASEMLFMLAYIPLLRFAVLVCPKKVEATNFAVITSIMNLGLALSDAASGALYEWLKTPTLGAAEIDPSAIDWLIVINIATSLLCLIVLPFLRLDRAVQR